MKRCVCIHCFAAHCFLSLFICVFFVLYCFYAADKRDMNGRNIGETALGIRVEA